MGWILMGTEAYCTIYKMGVGWMLIQHCEFFGWIFSKGIDITLRERGAAVICP